MGRRWKPFDQKTMEKELGSLPIHDMIELFKAMKAYQMDLGIGYTVSNYGEGLFMIKPSNRTQGRCLFFSVDQDNDMEVLTMLVAYKKESQKAERQKVDTARQRQRMLRGESKG